MESKNHTGQLEEGGRKRLGCWCLELSFGAVAYLVSGKRATQAPLDVERQRAGISGWGLLRCF